MPFPEAHSLFPHFAAGSALYSATGKQYYHHDALGSTVNLTDAGGDEQVSYVLDPWGHITGQTGTSVNRQIFTGQEHDEKTGLIYFGARYYDPDTARFMTQDPYLGEPGTPPSLHRYLYAYSNPTVYIDLMGYESLSKWFMDKVDKNLTEGNDWTAGALFVTRQVYNGLTFGFLDSHDPYYDKYERGEISGGEYALRTTAAAGKSAAVGGVVVVTGGTVGGAVAGFTSEVGAGAIVTTLASGAAGGSAAGVSGLFANDVYDVAAGGKFHSLDQYVSAAEEGAKFGAIGAGISYGMITTASRVAPGLTSASLQNTSQPRIFKEAFDAGARAGRNAKPGFDFLKSERGSIGGAGDASKSGVQGFSQSQLDDVAAQIRNKLKTSEGQVQIDVVGSRATGIRNPKNVARGIPQDVDIVVRPPEGARFKMRGRVNHNIDLLNQQLENKYGVPFDITKGQVNGSSVNIP